MWRDLCNGLVGKGYGSSFSFTLISALESIPNAKKKALASAVFKFTLYSCGVQRAHLIVPISLGYLLEHELTPQ